MKVAKAWKEPSGRHINIYEFRAFCKLVRRYAGRASLHHKRLVSVWDSRLGLAIAQRGRSSSNQMLQECRTLLPHLLGGDLETGGFWIASPFMPMDGPSRNKPVCARSAPPYRYFDKSRPLVPAAVIASFCENAEKKKFESSQASKQPAECH